MLQIDSEKQTVTTLKVYNPGLDRLSVTHCLTLRDSCLGCNPYLNQFYCISHIASKLQTFVVELLIDLTSVIIH